MKTLPCADGRIKVGDIVYETYFPLTVADFPSGKWEGYVCFDENYSAQKASTLYKDKSKAVGLWLERQLSFQIAAIKASITELENNFQKAVKVLLS